MYVIVNENNQRLSNAYSFKFADKGLRCCIWKKEETANNFLKRLHDEGRSGIRVEKVTAEDVEITSTKKKKKSEDHSNLQTFEENSFYKRTIPMDGEEIAQELGFTRQYVSNTLKSALRKIYYSLKDQNPDMTPFEIVNGVREFFGLEDADDIQMFFSCFPSDIRKEIKLSMM